MSGGLEWSARDTVQFTARILWVPGEDPLQIWTFGQVMFLIHSGSPENLMWLRLYPLENLTVFQAMWTSVC